jgi:hypothetical protein
MVIYGIHPYNKKEKNNMETNYTRKSVTAAQMKINYEVLDFETNQTINLVFRHSKHSFLRSCQRGLSKKIITVLEYGECYFKQGLIFYILGERNLPKVLDKEATHVKNIVVVVDGSSNQIITCYHSNNPFKNIKIKSKQLSRNYHYNA